MILGICDAYSGKCPSPNPTYFPPPPASHPPIPYTGFTGGDLTLWLLAALLLVTVGLVTLIMARRT